jgi:hypothetical protein
MKDLITTLYDNTVDLSSNEGSFNTYTTCKLQIINDKIMKWQTIGECIDAPNPKRKAIKKLSKKYGKNIWSNGIFGKKAEF